MAKYIEYINIPFSTYFSKLEQIPNNRELMDSFIILSDLKFFVPQEQINQIIQNKTLSAEQLDALFLLAGLAFLYMKNLSDTLKGIIEESKYALQHYFSDSTDFKLYDIDYLDMKADINDILSLEDFSECIISEIMVDLTYPVVFEFFKDHFISIFSNLNFGQKNAIEIEYYIKHDYERNHVLQNVIQRLFDTMFRIANEPSILGIKIANICSKDGFITANEESALRFFIQSQHHLENTILKSDFINIYNEDAKYIQSSYHRYYSDYNYYNQLTDGTGYYSNKYNQLTDGTDYTYGYNTTRWDNESSRWNYDRSDYANTRLADLNFEVLKTNQYFHSIIDCLLQHKVSTSTGKIIELLYETMLIERYTIGFADKYNAISLEDHYCMICIANDIKTEYDDFLIYIKKYSRLPYDYPVEVILRIVSRIFNVRIVFYSQQLIQLEVDNAIDEISTMYIYQHTSECFYNIVPKGTSFVPIGEQNVFKHIVPSNLSSDLFDLEISIEVVNDVNDVVEI